MSVKSKVRNATRVLVKAVTPEPDDASEADILDTLKKEHDEVKGLLSDLQDASTAAQRRKLVQKIKMALIPHTKAEERVVYDAVIALRDKDAQVDGHEGYLEHEWAAKTLQRLEALQNVTSPEHKAAAKVLKELVEHHIQEEENHIWEDLSEHFSSDDRKAMNAAFLRAKTRIRVG